MFVRAFYKTWTFYKNGLASLDLLFGKDIQAVLLSLAPRLEWTYAHPLTHAKPLPPAASINYLYIDLHGEVGPCEPHQIPNL